MRTKKESIKCRLFALGSLGLMSLFLYLFGQQIKYDRVVAALYGVSACCWLAIFFFFSVKAIMLEKGEPTSKKWKLYDCPPILYTLIVLANAATFLLGMVMFTWGI